MAQTRPGRLPRALAPLDVALLACASGGLGLTAEPYAALGAALGLGGDAVIERLRRLMAQAAIGGLGPCWAAHMPEDTPADLAQLRAATDCGLPLVTQPYEALGAMLGWSAQRVCDEFAAALRTGRLLRLAPWPPRPCSPR
ncbi:MAG: hypothetical protein ACOVQT_09815 [Rubrivivax sp.]